MSLRKVTAFHAVMMFAVAVAGCNGALGSIETVDTEAHGTAAEALTTDPVQVTAGSS